MIRAYDDNGNSIDVETVIKNNFDFMRKLTETHEKDTINLSQLKLLQKWIIDELEQEAKNAD